MSEHNNTTHHEHNYENCCDDHIPDNHGCGCCNEDHFNEHKKEEITKIIISTVFFAAGYIISKYTDLSSYIYLVCYLISYLMVGFDIVRDAADSFIHGKFFDENFLMSFASIGAFAIKEYTEGVAVVLLFTIGEFIQGLAVSRSRKSIDKIFAQKHKTYTLPRHYDNEESRTEQMITKFARTYTPVICVIAILVMIIPPIFLKQSWQEWIHRGFAALVVGCPCAIVISVPLCYSAGIGACSKDNIFVKNTSVLDEINACDTIITYDDNKSIDDIKVLQNNGHRVIYLGKGHNDLTMLEAADIAAAVGEDCTGDAVNLSDMVMINYYDNAIDDVKAVSKKIRAIALENIYFSIAVKMVILVLDVLLSKSIPMWFAIFGDIGVCLLAIANSARAIALGKRK